jgi:hypothetical protein
MQDNAHAVRTLTYHELLKVLHKKCKEKHTGIMVFKEDPENSAKFLITRGMIIDVVFKNKKGIAALQSIQKIRHAKPTFHVRPNPTQDIKRKIELSTEQIFKLLISGLTTASKKPQQQATPVSPKPVVKPVTASSMIEEVVVPDDTANIPEGGMIVIEAQLSVIIGPVAKIIFLNYAKDIIHNASDFKKLNAIVEKISKELLTPEQQKIFRHNILAFINQHGLKGHDLILYSLWLKLFF